MNQQITSEQVAEAAYQRYVTDAEFHAKVYRAAQIAQHAQQQRHEPAAFASALLAAAVALHLADSAGSTD